MMFFQIINFPFYAKWGCKFTFFLCFIVKSKTFSFCSFSSIYQPTPFFRGIPAVRFYLPASVPRWTALVQPTPDCGLTALSGVTKMSSLRDEDNRNHCHDKTGQVHASGRLVNYGVKKSAVREREERRAVRRCAKCIEHIKFFAV